MANKLISDLTAIGSVGATDLVEVEPAAGSPSRKATVAQLQTAILASAPIVFKTGVGVSHTGDTVETTLYSQVLPALGANSVVEVIFGATGVGVGGGKPIKIKLNGTEFYSSGVAGTAASYIHTVNRTIWNRGATNSQIMHHSTLRTNSYEISASTAPTFAIETNAGPTLTITGQVLSAGDTITLDAVLIKIWP